MAIRLLMLGAADLRREPSRGLSAALGDRGGWKIAVIGVDHVERIIAAIADPLDAFDEIDQCGAVIALRRKDAAVARGLDEIVQVPHVVRELDKEDALTGNRIERIARRAARQHMERVD